MIKNVSFRIASKEPGKPVIVQISNHTTTGMTAGWRLVEIKGIVPNDDQLLTFQYDMLDDVIIALQAIKEEK